MQPIDAGTSVDASNARPSPLSQGEQSPHLDHLARKVSSNKSNEYLEVAMTKPDAENPEGNLFYMIGIHH